MRCGAFDNYNAWRYSKAMIKSFRGEAELVWSGLRSSRLPHDIQSIQSIQSVARRKLRMINNATSLVDLTIPPGDALEALKGDRAGQHSVRINQQWRICFVWAGGNALDVEIVDYH